jgi:hypothetical protein
MLHIDHDASITTNCYAADRMRRYDDRKSNYYDQTIEERTGGTADALAERFYGVPGGCPLRNRDERGAA